MQDKGSSKAKWRGLPALIRGFATEDDGASFPVIAAVLIPLLGFVGLATDAARGYLVKARIGEALDAASLAAAHEVNAMTDKELKDYAKMVFDANFPPGYMGANVTMNDPKVDDINETVTITATADVGTTFMGLFHYDNMRVAGSTEVKRQTVSMDVVIAMDMSGSMDKKDGDSKMRIEEAVEASQVLVDILFGPDETKDLLLMGVVPWNSKVNIIEAGKPFEPGTVTSETLTDFVNPVGGGNTLYTSSNSPTVPLLANPSASWEGCVYARHKADGSKDNDADAMRGRGKSADGTQWEGWEPNTDKRSECPLYGITRLTNVKSTIINALDVLDNVPPDGHTNIAQGLAWSWRTVAPGAPFPDAEAFPTGFHQRAVVLLTDGQNTGHGAGAYKGKLSNGKIDDQARLIAENMKDEGIRIYVIQYKHKSGALANLMKDIATGRDAPFYNFAPDAAALQDIFQEVADDLSELRITK